MHTRDKIVVVTGAGSGIGAAMSRRFAADGAARVVVVDLDAAAADAVAAGLDDTGVAIGADLAREDEVHRVADTVERDIGPVDLWCSNAGILVLGGVGVPSDQWRRVLDVNLMAHVWAADAMVPRMLARGGGWLLHTASAAGLLTQIGSASYSVSKHAAVAFAEWLAISYGDAGLGVSVLCPQAVATAMTAGVVDGGPAGVDGMLSADAVADAVAEGLAAEHFLILPHPEVATYEQRRAADHDRWIRGMRRLQAQFLPGGMPAPSPPG